MPYDNTEETRLRLERLKDAEDQCVFYQGEFRAI